MKLIHYRAAVPNFGDDLNADLWPVLAPGLFDEDPARGFVGIGTLIGIDVGDVPRLDVFSSGVGYDPVDRWAAKDVRYHCVRGPLSARVLGLEPSAALTDGAILTPLAPGFPLARGEGRGTVVVPHFQTLAYPGWDKVMATTGFELVDPRGSAQAVIGRIASAGLVLTESLHGAILADTYGVPWIAFATSRNFSVSKWLDWTESVGVPLRVTMVPPPDPQPLIAFGRRPEPFGSVLGFDVEGAIAEFHRRMAPARAPVRARPREVVKDWIKRQAFLRPLMGFSPGRTGEALARLARDEALTSAAPRREKLRSQMLERLDALRSKTQE